MIPTDPTAYLARLEAADPDCVEKNYLRLRMVEDDLRTRAAALEDLRRRAETLIRRVAR